MKTIEEIAREVEVEYQMGGLFDGIHESFVREVAKRFGTECVKETIEIAKVHMESVEDFDDEGTEANSVKCLGL